MSTPDRLDVDARFLLANERTMLAWVRTSLTLLASAAAVQQFGEDVDGRAWLALVLAALGTFSAVTGGLRYAAADRALRRGALPATGRMPYAMAGVVAVLGLLLAVALALAALA